MGKQQNKVRLKAAYPFGTVGYFTHRSKEYPCVVVGLEESGGFQLFHQGGLIFPERNPPLFAEPNEFRADPSLDLVPRLRSNPYARTTDSDTTKVIFPYNAQLEDEYAAQATIRYTQELGNRVMWIRERSSMAEVSPNSTAEE